MMTFGNAKLTLWKSSQLFLKYSSWRKGAKKKSSFKSGMGLPHSNAEPVGFLD